MAMRDYIPFGLTENILCLLPVKSLLRFRCVSMRWLFLIKDPDFIKRHLQRTTQTNRHCSLVTIVKTQLCSVDLDSNSLANNPLISQLSSEIGPVELVGECNGLLCLSCWHNHSIILLNVSTRKYHTLPPVPQGYILSGSQMIGFGYDPGSDDYKVVRVDNHVAMFYSVRLNSWKAEYHKTCFWQCYYKTFTCDLAVLASGALHWLSTASASLMLLALAANNEEHLIQAYPDGEGPLLLALDLNTEEFRALPFPVDEDNKLVFASIGVLGGCLCAMDSNDRRDVGIWVMKEYGKKESWERLFSIPYLGKEVISYPYPVTYPSYNVLTWTGNGNDEVLLVLDDKELFHYNPKEKKARRIDIPGLPTFFQAQICHQSLVPINSNSED